MESIETNETPGHAVSRASQVILDQAEAHLGARPFVVLQPEVRERLAALGAHDIDLPWAHPDLRLSVLARTAFFVDSFRDGAEELHLAGAPIISPTEECIGVLALRLAVPGSPAAGVRDVLELCAFQLGVNLSALDRGSDEAGDTIHVRAVVSQLRSSRELFQIFMDNTPAVAFMKNGDGQYIYVNRQFEDTFQTSIDQVWGQTDFDIFPESVALQNQANDAAMRASGATLRAIEMVPAPDGRRQYWAVAKFPITNADGEEYVGGVAMDITAQKLAEEQTQEEARKLAMIVELQQRLAAADLELERALTLAIDAIQRLVKADAAVYEIVEGDELVYRAANGSAAPFVGLRLKVEKSLSGRCMAANMLVECTDSETDPRVNREACRKTGVRSMLIVPITGGDHRPLGVLKVTSVHANYFTPADADSLQIAAGIVSVALRNISLLASATDLVGERTVALDRATASEDRFRAALDGSGSIFVLLNPSGGSPAGPEDFVISDANQVAADLARSTVADLRGVPFSQALLFPEPGPFEECVVRALNTGAPLDEEFESRDAAGATVWFRAQFVPVNGGVACTARDVTARRHILESMRASRELAYHVASATSLEGALQTILSRICGVTGWSLGQVWLPAADGRLVCDAVWYSARPEYDTFRAESLAASFARGEGLPGIAADRKSAIIVTDLFKSGLIRTAAALVDGLTAACAVPVMVNNEAVAVLEFWTDSPLVDADLVLEAVTVATEQLGELIVRKQDEVRMRSTAERYRATAETANDAIITADSTGLITQFNTAAQRMFGYTFDEAVGQPLTLLMPERFRSAHLAGLARVVGGGETRVVGNTVELVALTQSGQEIPIELSIGMWETAEGKFFTGIIRDITPRKEYEAHLALRAIESAQYSQQLEIDNEKLNTMATTDPLTGLMNRRAFDERLERELKWAQARGLGLSLLMIDVDHFKAFNDQFGHPAGDDALKRTADLLSRCTRSIDCAVRYGGEEFAVILAGADCSGALRAAEKIRARVEAGPWTRRQITVSVGLACLTPDIANAADLVQRADLALYEAKAAGRNQVAHQAHDPEPSNGGSTPGG